MIGRHSILAGFLATLLRPRPRAPSRRASRTARSRRKRPAARCPSRSGRSSARSPTSRGSATRSRPSTASARCAASTRQRHHVRERRIQRAATAAAPAASSLRATEHGQPDRPADSRRPGRSSSKPPARMVVLFRIAERKVDRIRVFSEDCELDAGGRPLIWLDGVRPADSVALLETLAVRRARPPQQRTDGRRDHRDCASRRSSRGRGARPAGRRDAARSGAPEGDVLARQRTRRARPGHASARA